jgi:hypothetical protein
MKMRLLTRSATRRRYATGRCGSEAAGQSQIAVLLIGDGQSPQGGQERIVGIVGMRRGGRGGSDVGRAAGGIMAWLVMSVAMAMPVPMSGRGQIRSWLK